MFHGAQVLVLGIFESLFNLILTLIMNEESEVELKNRMFNVTGDMKLYGRLIFKLMCHAKEFSLARE